MTGQDTTLEKVRKLLAKAEAEGTTPPEAEALTAKATELMARYGIDRARLAATSPGTDQLANRIIDVPNPWARVHAYLLCRVFDAMRCKCILLVSRHPGQRVHVFGYASDIERAEMLYTSLLLQAAHGLAAAKVPPHLERGRVRAWHRSWLLGFAGEVAYRIKAAENRAAEQAEAEDTPASGPGTALVLADRSLAVQNAAEQTYPAARTTRITFSGTGYRDGRAAGQRADIGTARVRAGARGALKG